MARRIRISPSATPCQRKERLPRPNPESSGVARFNRPSCQLKSNTEAIDSFSRQYQYDTRDRLLQELFETGSIVHFRFHATNSLNNCTQHRLMSFRHDTPNELSKSNVTSDPDHPYFNPFCHTSAPGNRPSTRQSQSQDACCKQGQDSIQSPSAQTSSVENSLA